MNMHVSEPLPDTDLESPPPPTDPTKTWLYGYKFLDRFDQNSEEDLEIMSKVLTAVDGLHEHAQIIYKPSVLLVFLAAFHPGVNVTITPRPDSHKVPSRHVLEHFEKEAGSDCGPSWFPENGLFFSAGRTPESCLKPVQPFEEFWGLSH